MKKSKKIVAKRLQAEKNKQKFHWRNKLKVAKMPVNLTNHFGKIISIERNLFDGKEI